MFDDITRMLEREFQLIAFHGEDAPVAAGRVRSEPPKCTESAVAPRLLIRLRVGTMLSPELNRMEAWKMVS